MKETKKEVAEVVPMTEVPEATPKADPWIMKKLCRRFENVKLKKYLKGKTFHSSHAFGTYIDPHPVPPNHKKVKANKGRKHVECVGTPPSKKKNRNLKKNREKTQQIREKRLEKRNG